MKGLGYGKANTYKICHKSATKALTEGNCVAYRVSQYSTSSTKAGEWFLPSKDELGLMYKSMKDRVLATRDGNSMWLWSSSESGRKFAWKQHYFVDGSQLDSYKVIRWSVRGVCSF